MHAMPQEQHLMLQLHELFAFLNRQGVVTIIVLAQQRVMGPMQTPVDVTYLADSAIVTRYFEADGAVRKALSVVKKRSGAHEDTIRAMTIDSGGFVVSRPSVNTRHIRVRSIFWLGTYSLPRLPCGRTIKPSAHNGATLGPYPAIAGSSPALTLSLAHRRIGAPLRHFRGVMTGVPVYVGAGGGSVAPNTKHDDR